MKDVTGEIQDPEKKISVWKRRQRREIFLAGSADDRQGIRQRMDTRIEALGSGSDWTVFLQHLGIASLNLGYGGESGGGIYHSVYDDFYWYTHFGDPDFAYGKALSQTAGSAVLRLADADLLPFDFSDFAETVQRYVHELEKLAKDQTRSEEHTSELQSHLNIVCRLLLEKKKNA